MDTLTFASPSFVLTGIALWVVPGTAIAAVVYYVLRFPELRRSPLDAEPVVSRRAGGIVAGVLLVASALGGYMDQGRAFHSMTLTPTRVVLTFAWPSRSIAVGWTDVASLTSESHASRSGPRVRLRLTTRHGKEYESVAIAEYRAGAIWERLSRDSAAVRAMAAARAPRSR